MTKELQVKLDALNEKRIKSGLSGKEEVQCIDIIDELRELKNSKTKKQPEFRLTGG